MEKVTIIVLCTFFLSEVTLLCSGVALNPSGSGGSLRGDPAPGRSPGPPELTATNVLKVEDQTIKHDSACTMEGADFDSKELNFINMTIHHKIFKTDVLVPGIKYKVIIQRMDQEGPTIDFVISTTMGEKLSGEFQGHQYPDCGPHIFTSQLKSNEVSLNWTFQASVDYTRPNITFQLKYRYDKYTYQILYTYPIMEDCQLYLREEEAEFGHRDIPHTSDCQVWFPIRESGHGLVIELLKLNVPCSKGYIHFSGLNVTQHQHFRTHKQTQICGKLEELPDSDRHIYFPSSPMSPFMQVHGSPIFSLNYHLVDYCYNVTFVAKNGSFELKPSGELQCTFKIYLPYGNRVAMNLQIGDSTSTGSPETGSSFQDNKNSDSLCNGLLTQLHDGGNTWSHCTIAGDAERQIEMVSRENKVVLKVSVRSGSGGALGLRMTYRAEPVESIVGMCGFGWVALRQFCVSAPEGPRLPWAQAEMECTRRGGHLASIRNQHDQAVVDSLLLNRNLKLICEYCKKEFASIYSRNRHLKNIHEKEGCASSRSQHILCPLCPEEKKFLLYDDLNTHLKNIHDVDLKENILQFNNIKEFEVWRLQENRDVDYACHRRNKGPRGEETIYYNCNRSDTKGYVSRCNKRSLKSGGSIRIRGVCPSKIIVKISAEGLVIAKFTETHVGHIDELRTKKLTKAQQNTIVEQLTAGVSTERIIQNARILKNDTLERLNIISRGDLAYLVRKFNIDKKRDTDDMAATALKIEEWNKQGKNYAFLFKQIGESYLGLKTEDFAVGYMNGIMEKKLREFSKIICIDGTHGTNRMNFELTMVLVKDNNNMGFPVAFLLTNRLDQKIQEIFFTALKTKLGNEAIKVNYIMSDDDPKYFNAWTNVMTEEEKPRRLLCTWHIIKNWNIQGRSKLKKPENRQEMKKEMRKILKETNIEKFNDLKEKYLKHLEHEGENDFLRYLKRNYFQSEERVMMWAHCFRNNVGINTNMAVESLNKVLKYNKMNGKRNIRPGYRDHNAYWIGASDKTHEGDFRWSDGLPFLFTNWFPGWAQHGYYNRQPNDDGLSEQDCVEIRRVYSLPTSSLSLTTNFMWNDRDCSTPNYFICERLQNDEPLEDSWPPDCNRSVVLSRQQPRASISSPGFPRQYPDNADCDTDITAPTGYRIVLDFEELVLENEPSCSYDSLEILERSSNATFNSSGSTRRLCGDWSSKLKLLRYVSGGSRLKLRFSSDYSHHFGGFKARVSMENAMQCADDRLIMFNNSCYLIVSYPEVTWNTAQQICRGIKANLASIISPDEERFIITNIRKSAEYRTSALYWLGANTNNKNDFTWIDKEPMNYLGWLPGQKPEIDDVKSNENVSCLGIRWTPSPTPMLPSGLYWKPHRCDSIGGYVCKRRHQLLGIGINFNKTLNGSDGTFSTPNYPGSYYNNLDFSVRIVGPERTRLVIQFKTLDIEPQQECLYDYVELQSAYKSGKQSSDSVKWCGSHDTDMHRFDFVSESNEAEINFHSDYSISGSGFILTWQAIDVSACPMQTLTAKEGVLTSPNYPDFLLAHLDCTVTILAPAGKRVWLHFENIDIPKILDDDDLNNKESNEVILEINLSKHSSAFKPCAIKGILTEGTFVSSEERLQLKLRTGNTPKGSGFRATYKITNFMAEERTISLSNYTCGLLLHLNYPDNPAANVDFLQHFRAPLGYIINLELYDVKLSDIDDCNESNGIIEVFDNYADVNGTSWKLCYDPDRQDAIIPAAPISITSFLNTIHLRQRNRLLGAPLNGSLKVQLDEGYKNKLLNYKEERVEACEPNPCLNTGKCISKKKTFCQCQGHFTGIFCALTQCELEPCVFGTCELTNTSYKCHCKTGYVGPTCEQKRKPCEGNPCESRGACIERGDGFYCRCHAWWEGARCEKRMMHIPYKPLSERMFHEPFWLGLMTVFFVMGVIGLVWCAKRHFPEKIEKLLAEDNDRNRSTMSSLRSTSVREQLAAASAAATGGSTVPVAPSPGPGAPRSLFGRLGIRKPSILSLTSPHASGYVPATARTFSLDDLLKPPPRRSPSPKKKRNNSTPSKKNVAEKKQILQHLISPGNKHSSRKVSLGELIQMTERAPKGGEDLLLDNSPTAVLETKFLESDPVQSALNDPKLEKKVTFARLLNKVSAEMSSGSDIELGIMQTNKLGCMFARPSSTPPSPTVDVRSPNSTSSNQGSDSLTSSDFAISVFSSSISDLLNNRRHSRLPNGRQKPASADSILAMFKNFSSSSASANLPSSLRVSPSTTPTASSPQDDIAGDDESSTSSIPTPVSFSSGPPESPIMHRSNQNNNSIEVPVLDTLSAHKSPNSGSNFLHPPTILLEIPSTINKCLSPIREMPTPLPSPMPSPAFTPIMRRSTASSSIEDADISDDRISIDLPNISINCSDLDEDELDCTDIVIDPQAEDGLILEEAAAMQQNSFYRIKNQRPPPLGQLSDISGGNIKITVQPPPLEIPILIIQTPSPTHTVAPSALFPGSPPPRSFKESCFQFPSPKQTRKMYKDFDKPTSLDLPCAPPMITITCNMSEAESDIDSISPAVKAAGHLGVGPSGMSYLSPFSMVARGDHNASESNLSSSGYSSMASPGPSRCGSSNPLCPSEMEDPGPGGSQRRMSLTPILKPSSTTEDSENKNKTEDQRRGRSDSETLSDDPLLESNDEGIGTDHLDEKIEDGEVKSAKELEVFIGNDSDSSKTVCDVPMLAPPRAAKSVSLDITIDRLLPPPPGGCNFKNSLQLPSIVVQCDSPGGEKMLSPMSSRSESPLSDRMTGVSRFSPQFYGRNKDLLPFTDSDGLYDFPSSDKDANAMMLPKPHQNAKHQKISRLRAISHQIRFLRRLELSLKRRERTVSPSDSLDSGEESPRATSPLLSSSRSGSKVEIRKSSSIGKLQVNNSAKTRRIKYKRGEYLLQPDDKSWKKVVITGNGHSD